MSNVLWASQPLLGAAVAVRYGARSCTSFPYFMAYLVAQVAAVAVLFPVYNFASDHFYHAIGMPLIGRKRGWTSLGFKVLHEISWTSSAPTTQ